MREIIFRGKRTDVDAWAYGYLNKHPSAIQVGKGSPYYIEIPPQDPDDDGGRYNVHRGTVGQFTGLHDKHGNKIFEGDYVEYKEEIGVIEYHDQEAMFMVAFDTWISDFDHLYGHDVEIIGNIHDKHELLKTEDAGK